MKRERNAKPVRQRIVLLGLLAAAAGAPATALYADPACSCSSSDPFCCVCRVTCSSGGCVAWCDACVPDSSSC